MHLIFRRFVYTFFILVFLVAAPLILLYTQGYRYDFSHSRIQKTGILIVSSSPKKAEIFLNGQAAGKTTPAKIEQILPADYEIKLVKEGYHDWQKKLTVNENGTTFAENILLWKNSLPTLQQNFNVASWLVSPDKSQIAVLSDRGEVAVLPDDNGGLQSLCQLTESGQPQLLGWSNTSKKLALKTGTGHYLIIQTAYPQQEFQSLADKNYQVLKWDRQNDNIVYALNQNGLWSIDLFNANQPKLIANKKMTDFLADQNTVYFINQGELFSQASGANQSSTLLYRSQCPNCSLETIKQEKIFLLDRVGQKLIIFDPKQPQTPITENAKGLDWLNDNTLLFYNDWEIWLYHLDKKEPELVTRFGTPIVQAVWHPSGRHIVFVNDNKIKIIELDNRELRNIIELASAAKITVCNLDGKGKNLYFSGALGGQSGIFQLALQ